jgi:hypothetical protein
MKKKLIGTLYSLNLEKFDSKIKIKILKEISFNKIKYVVFYVFFLLLITWICFDISEVFIGLFYIGEKTSSCFLAQGIFVGFFTYIIMLFIFVPIIAEFFTMLIRINFIFPFKFVANTPELNFSDTELFVGLKPLGNLFLFSSQIYFISVALASLLPFYILIIARIPAQIGPGTISFFIVLWIFGFLFFYFPIFIIHKYIQKHKNKIIADIDREIQDLGHDPFGFLKTIPINFEETIDNIHLYMKFNHAKGIREYPINIATIRDLFMAALLPIAIEILIRLL